MIDGAVAAAGFIADGTAFVTGVAVASDERGNGKGSEVLKGLTARLISNGNTRIFVSSTDETANFYIKNGFEICGECAVMGI